MKTYLVSLKGILLFAFCAFYALSGYAQEASEAKGKPTVFIDYFSRSSDVSEIWAEALRNNVIEGIQNTNRVILIDVDTQSALRKEKARREAENVSTGDDNDMERVAVMQQLGANYLIKGLVNSVAVTKSTTDDGNVYYSATLTYTLKVIDPKTGTLVGTKTLKHGGGLTDMTTGDTQDEAVSKISARAIKGVRVFIDENFQMEGTILEISAEKKGEAKEVYISLGSENGVGGDTNFEVFVSRQVAGRDSRKLVGSLKVKAVEGADISLCEVKKGGKEIKDAMDAQQAIVIKLAPKKVSFLDKAANAVNNL